MEGGEEGNRLHLLIGHMFPPVQRRRRKRKERRGHIRRQSEKHCFKEVNHRMSQVQTGRLVHTLMLALF